jgi:hypothetical protein
LPQLQAVQSKIERLQKHIRRDPIYIASHAVGSGSDE